MRGLCWTVFVFVFLASFCAYFDLAEARPRSSELFERDVLRRRLRSPRGLRPRASIQPCSSASELVTNGGFETGDLSGWTPNASGCQGSGCTQTVDNVAAAGQYAYAANVQTDFNSAYSSVDLSQQVSGLCVGRTYAITASIRQDGAADPSDTYAYVQIDGNALITVNPNDGSYSTYTSTFVASSTSVQLNLANIDVDYDRSVIHWDSISISPSP